MKLTPYAQEQPHSCAVACLRMVAEHYGISRTEAELLPLCGTTHNGTTAAELARAARRLGLAATVTYSDLTVMQAALNQPQPVIVFLGLPAPPPSSDIDIHAVVVIAIDSDTITFIDPIDGMEHSQGCDDFLTNWQRAYNISILITHP